MPSSARPRTPGPIVTPEGREVGRHEGLAYYTLGQRQGLRIGGRHGAAKAPWFIAGKDMAKNALVAVQGHDHPLLHRSDVGVADMHWIAGVGPPLPAQFSGKTRYRMPDAGCELRAADQDGVTATFDVPQWAPTPGQSLVLYDGDVCLGGGAIDGLMLQE